MPPDDRRPDLDGAASCPAPAPTPPAPAGGATFAEIVARRYRRRGLLRAGLVVGAAAAAAPALGHLAGRPAAAQKGMGASSPSFTPIAAQPTTVDQIVVPPGYRAQVLLRWGDPLVAGLPPFRLDTQTAALQERRVGYNHDFLGFYPLPRGSQNADEGLLWINHEYTEGERMFLDYAVGNPRQEHVDIELAAHGGAVVHLRRGGTGAWNVALDSRYNRRITATTPMRLSGPAAGDAMLRTSADPSGTLVLGSLNNCGGGSTPWGTVLTAEENFNQYFANAGALPESDPRRALHQRYGLPSAKSERLWEAYYDRFDVAKEPNEPLRFGWIVEIDPYDPSFQPVKRTALGRMKHEAATTVVAPDGRVVAYSGDDERFDYAYKFVTQGAYDPNNRAANRDLLDRGTLYVARYDPDGAGEWLPLTFGQGSLTPANGFTSQADVLIRTRQAADRLGATKMDRPEDMEASPTTGKVYLALTNNTNRGSGNNPGPDAANPRADNRWGHIIEMTEDGGDPTATSFRWEIFLLCGDPADASSYFAGFPKDQVSTISAPDNVAFDRQGNLWIATDGQPSTVRLNDGVFMVPTEGADRGHLRQFASAVAGAEVCGPLFSPDERTFFFAVQHPGEQGTPANPQSVWPNAPTGPAMPAVVAVTRVDGRPISG